MADLRYLLKRKMPKRPQRAPAAIGMTLRKGKQIHVSEALAVHPMDAAQAEANARKDGFNIHFDSEGRPHFDSLLQKEKYAKTQGMHFRRKSKSTPGDSRGKTGRRRTRT